MVSKQRPEIFVGRLHVPEKYHFKKIVLKVMTEEKDDYEENKQVAFNKTKLFPLKGLVEKGVKDFLERSKQC